MGPAAVRPPGWLGVGWSTHRDLTIPPGPQFKVPGEQNTLPGVVRAHSSGNWVWHFPHGATQAWPATHQTPSLEGVSGCSGLLPRCLAQLCSWAKPGQAVVSPPATPPGTTPHLVQFAYLMRNLHMASSRRAKQQACLMQRGCNCLASPGSCYVKGTVRGRSPTVYSKDPHITCRRTLCPAHEAGQLGAEG